MFGTVNAISIIKYKKENGMYDLLLVGFKEEDIKLFTDNGFFKSFKISFCADLISALKLVVDSDGCLLFIDFDNKEIKPIFRFDKTEGTEKIQYVAVMTKNDSLRNIRAIKRNVVDRIFLKPLDIRLIQKGITEFK